MKKSKQPLHGLSGELAKISTHLSGLANSVVQLLKRWLQSTPTAVPPILLPAVSAPAPVRKAPSGRKTRTRVPAIDWDWDRILPVARRILRSAPERRWTSSDFCRAVRKACTGIDSGRGLHFGLIPRLADEGLITRGDNGTFVALKSAQKRRAKSPRKPKAAKVSRRAKSRSRARTPRAKAAGRSTETVEAANPAPTAPTPEPAAQ
ncbi:MAG: hypothetical protein HY815_02070 [Candidatus Riflebacteria bacterium]|nr:hypothetical protein [Candidatus Riflebacteria bacterium]